MNANPLNTIARFWRVNPIIAEDSLRYQAQELRGVIRRRRESNITAPISNNMLLDWLAGRGMNSSDLARSPAGAAWVEWMRANVSGI